MLCDKCKETIEKVKFRIGDKPISIPIHIMCFDMECENGGNPLKARIDFDKKEECEKKEDNS